MQKLQSLLDKHEIATMVGFDHLNHRICCYAHIVNICSSHIIASMTSTSTSFSNPRAPLHSHHTICNESDDSYGGSDRDSDDVSDDNESNLDTLEPCLCFDDRGDAELGQWFAGIKHDPLKCARKVVRFLHSSDQHREGLHKFIKDGNKHSWFTGKDNGGKCITLQILQMELLRDVRTWWDSVYMMLEHLRQLRLVRFPQ
jgi:hypothetical protein